MYHNRIMYSEGAGEDEKKMNVSKSLNLCQIIKFYVVLLILFGITIGAVYYTIKILFSDCSIGNLAEIITALISFLAFIVAYQSYQSHLESERVKLLCDYNKRYCTDPVIKKVIEWILKNSITNNEGDIVGVDTNKMLTNKSEMPTVMEKELFMRFFEELNVQIKYKNINVDDVRRLVSFYAIIFNNFSDFRKDITDYNYGDEYNKDISEINENIKNDNWRDFREFVLLMKNK